MERLIIFTRYPEPGKTKTRLIPALGAEGAAILQLQMAEHTLMQVRKLPPLSVEIWFTGGNYQLMQDWLGSSWAYQLQGEGDLGARLVKAFETGFAAGASRVVAIGTDCPDLDADKLMQAFHALQQHDLVLGPAIDGGYYLVGLSRLIPELFSGISWSTAEVLQQTVEIANQLGLSIAYLAPLADVDRPEDLPIWYNTTRSR